MKTIKVLMSVYNGEKYLGMQLDSIIGQDCELKKEAKLSILVRDDGSSDNSREILKEYRKKYPDKIEWFAGENKGVIASFFELMENAGEADYYAFSDQDDYWLPDKLSAAIKIIRRKSFIIPESTGKEIELPFLYACAPVLVDEDLNTIHSEINRENYRPSFENALVENICIGCTEVFNKKLYDIVAGRFPRFTGMHDWWMYLVAECFGKVWYDYDRHFLYRQHKDNVIGMNTSAVKEFMMRVKRFHKNRGNISSQVRELLRIYGGLADIDVSLYENSKRTLTAFPEKVKYSYDAEGNSVVEKNSSDSASVYGCTAESGSGSTGCPKSRYSVRNLKKAECMLANKSFGKRKNFYRKAGIYRQRKQDDMILKIIFCLGMY